MAIDFKKTQKELYQPTTSPSIIDVPKMTFIAVDGKGNPNTGAEYKAALEVLYGLSYAIKMSNKAVLEYVVPPLEGLWWSADGGVITDISNKDNFAWTAMIRQPYFVTEEVFENAKSAVAKKKSDLNLSLARLIKYTEGLCAQILHVGSYDDEPATVAALDKFIAESGYTTDFSDTRRHHEIYLGDPRKTAPEKLKTVIRYPIARL